MSEPDTTNQQSPIRLLGAAREELLVDQARTYRRPVDAVFVGLSIVTLVITSLIVLARRGLFENIDFGTFRSVNLFALPEIVIDSLIGVMQFGSLAAVPVLSVLAVLLRRIRLARNLFIAGISAWFLNKVFKQLLLRERPTELIRDLTIRISEPSGLGFPSGHATVAAAMATVAHPYLSRRLRWVSWTLVALVAFARVYVGAHFPLDVIGGVALGMLIGSVVNLVFGVPEETIPKDAVQTAFEQYDTPIKNVEALPADARGSVPYTVEAENGDAYFVKVVGTEHRNADFLFKIWRAVMFSGTGNRTPFLTPMQQVEHEAYLIMRARDEGVRTPGVEFTTDVHDQFALIAQKQVAGSELSEVEESRLDDQVVHDLWRQVKLLHEVHIAHRDLRPTNVMIDDENQVWLVDYGYAVAGANQSTKGIDIAQVLTELAPIGGVETAVDDALDVLGQDAVVYAIPALQPMLIAEESAARHQAAADENLLDELRDAITDRVETEIPEDATVLRIEPSTVLWVVGLGVGIFLLYPQLSELGQVVEAWRQANPLWLLAGLIGSALTYFLAAVQQHGALQEPPRYVRSVIAQFGATFANRFGPRGVGAVIVMEQFLENSGLSRREAIAGLGLKRTAGALVHFIGMLLVVLLLGTTQVSDISIVQTIQQNWALIVGGLLTALLVVVLLWKPLDLGQYVDPIKKALADLRETMKQPVNTAMLFSGSIALTLAYILTLMVSMWAVGASATVVTAAAVFLAGSIIGSASPTPGGLGVLEGAFVAGFTAFGVGANLAVAGILLYRLLTFWLPILPGVVAFRYLQNEGSI